MAFEYGIYFYECGFREKSFADFLFLYHFREQHWSSGRLVHLGGSVRRFFQWSALFIYLLMIYTSFQFRNIYIFRNVGAQIIIDTFVTSGESKLYINLFVDINNYES